LKHPIIETVSVVTDQDAPALGLDAARMIVAAAAAEVGDLEKASGRAAARA